MKIGVISDTHGLLRPEAIDALQGSELIVHAGGRGDPAILDRLRQVAPTTAVRGNIDTASWARRAFRSPRWSTRAECNSTCCIVSRSSISIRARRDSLSSFQATHRPEARTAPRAVPRSGKRGSAPVFIADRAGAAGRDRDAGVARDRRTPCEPACMTHAEPCYFYRSVVLSDILSTIDPAQLAVAAAATLGYACTSVILQRAYVETTTAANAAQRAVRRRD